MRGPNYWSNYRQKLIVTKLDIGHLEQCPTNQLPSFNENLKTILPSLQGHRCSKGHDGGFFERMEEGTWIGHVIEHVALELQCLAGMECGFGRTRGAGEKGVYHVVISYLIEEAGEYAMTAAIDLCEKLIAGEMPDPAPVIARLVEIKNRLGFGPSTRAIMDEAIRRGIPVKGMNDGSLIMLGMGINQKKVRASITGNTSNIGVEVACDKEKTKQWLQAAHVPVAAGDLVRTLEGCLEVASEIGYPLVVKPVNGNHGRGVTTNIRDEQTLKKAFTVAKEISDHVVVERFISGNDYRFLVVNYKLVAVAKRTPAMVIGDGVQTIAELIEEVNKDPERGDGHEKSLTAIVVDDLTREILQRRQLTLQSVLPIGEILFLKDTANLSTGGTSIDVTDHVHPDNAFLAERIARIIGLDICGIDVVAEDVVRPIDGKNGVVLEVNACPGLRMHLHPTKGLARNVAEPIVEMLFPKGNDGRIPLVAITGTNGKTTTTRLIAHMARSEGKVTGFTTTDGIYIDGRLVNAGDCTGSQSAAAVLNDPTVEFAVLECARGGILRHGLGFDNCNISVITNISEDHLGLKGINTLKDLARVKEVVARSTFDHGYCILNADDDLVYEMRNSLTCKIALFSTSANNPRVKSHCREGGLAAIIEKGYFTICKGEWRIRVCRVDAVPITFEGKAECMIKNVLPSILAAMIADFKIESIRTALMSFIPSPEMTPGRMNVFHFRNFDVIVDYVHNPGGFKELASFMERSTYAKKIGIITAVGDRRDVDIRNIGQISASIFDEIYIRHDDDMRGRDKEHLNSLLIEGVKSANENVPVRIIPDCFEALDEAMKQAPKGSVILIGVEKVSEVLRFVEWRQNEERENYRDFDKLFNR